MCTDTQTTPGKAREWDREAGERLRITISIVGTLAHIVQAASLWSIGWLDKPGPGRSQSDRTFKITLGKSKAFVILSPLLTLGKGSYSHLASDSDASPMQKHTHKCAQSRTKFYTPTPLLRELPLPGLSALVASNSQIYTRPWFLGIAVWTLVLSQPTRYFACNWTILFSGP